MDIISWVAAKEFLLIQQTEGKALETLVKLLDVVLTCLFFTRWEVPTKDVMRIAHLMLTHILMIAPETSFDKVHLHFLLPFVLHRKPDVCFGIQFIYKLEERTCLQQPVTDLVLDVRKYLKEFSDADLRVTQDVA